MESKPTSYIQQLKLSPFCSLQDGTGNIFNLTLNKEGPSFQPLPKEDHSTGTWSSWRKQLTSGSTAGTNIALAARIRGALE